MDVKIVKHKMYEDTPKYAKEGDAGIDLMAVEIIFEDDAQIIYNTGISIEIPKGYVGLVYPRSSIRKKPLVMANSVGVVDSGYRGEIQTTFNKLENPIDVHDLYQVGDRICQLIIVPYPKINLIPVQKLQDSVRGNTGHGSTGL